MPTSQDKLVRVFISSTFKDMHAERDHLVTVVFPELRERCERLGLEFFDVDLRWGVPEKGADGETANSWEYCRKWIDRVEPFFLGILGQRYGWVPPPENLKDEADRARQAQDPRSITDMEVRYGVLDSRLKRRSCFYLRTTLVPELNANASDEAKELHAAFVDTGTDADKLKALKSEVRASDRPVRDYPCQWTGNGFTGMEEFGAMVLEDLWSGVLRDERYVKKDVWQQVLSAAPDTDARYTEESIPVSREVWEPIIALAKPEPKEPLEKEREQMAAFAASRLRWFHGRTRELDELKSFILAPAAEDASRLAVIAAVSGQGKSALMAKLSETLQPQASGLQPSSVVVSHFVGATGQSSSSYNLVKRLLDELDHSGIAWPEPPHEEGKPKEDPKLDFQSLRQRLWDRLGDYAGERRIVILLDALNQLDDGHELGWLPYRLGPNVRVVVSCIEEPFVVPASAGQTASPDRVNAELPTPPAQKVLAALDSRHPKPKRIPLSGLDAEDVRTIVIEYLAEYCKELDTPHVDAICEGTKLPQARNPLYLLVMLAELRTLGGNEMNKVVPGLIAGMAKNQPDTVSLFQWVLERMEKAEGFGAEAVRWWCLYLALGRVGMASRELADLLARKLGPAAVFTAQRIERGLRRYLQRREGTLDFFHGQLRQAVIERYGNEADVLQAHRQIAGYFRALADPKGNQSWSGASLRPFQEIAFHLIGAQAWDDLCAYLTDLACLDRRARDRQVFAVVLDQRAAIAALPEFAEEARCERERVEECARYGAALVAYARECAAGKTPPPPVPPSIERLQAAGELPEANQKRLGMTRSSTERFESARQLSEERSPRAKRLRNFANFTATNAGLLSLWPEDLLPVAANHAEDGQLTEAVSLLSKRAQPWIARSPRPPAPPIRPQCICTLVGHFFDVTSVSVTPDGRRAVSGSQDNTLRVWDLQSGQCLLTLQGHTNEVRSVSVTPDGRRAVSASWDKTLRVWDLASGQCLHTLQGHTSNVDSVSVTPDGRRAVSGSQDNTLRVWDLESGQCIHALQGHTGAVITAGVTPDGRRAVSGSQDNTLRVWDLESGQCLHILEGHTLEVTYVSVTGDGTRAVSGSRDGSLRIWDLVSGHCLQTVRCPSLESLGVTADGRRAVVVGSFSEPLFVWDLDSGQCLNILLPERNLAFTSVSVMPNGRHAISGSRDGTLRVWDMDSGQLRKNLDEHTDLVSSVSVTPDGRRAVSGSHDSTLRVWDLTSGQCLHTLDPHGYGDTVHCVTVTPDGRRAVSGSQGNTLRVWDLESGQCIHALQGHTGAVITAGVTPDGRRAVSGSQDNTLRVWDLQSGQCLLTLQGHADPVNSVSVTPDGRRAVSASWDKTLRVWDLHSGQCLLTLQGHTSFVWGVSVTPDGQRAVSASWDDTLRVWDLASGQCLHTLQGHTSNVDSVSVTPDGRLAVSGSQDNTLRLWDLETGQCLVKLQDVNGITNVSAISNGKLAVSGSRVKTLRIWDLESARCLGRV